MIKYIQNINGRGLVTLEEESSAEADIKRLEDEIKPAIIVEILHNLGFMPNDVYWDLYPDNAETLDKNCELWRTLQEVDEAIERYEKGEK